MEYLLSFLLLLLNLIDYEYDLGHAVFLLIGTVLFSVLFFIVFRKTKNFIAACIIMMCHTWQISWVNILGDPTSELQLPWFYILGAMVVIYAILNFHKIMYREYSLPILITFVAFLIIFNYPLFISQSFSEGLKEYIMIGFFVAVLFVAFFFRDTIPKSCYYHYKTAFIWAAFTSSIFLIIQYFAYTKFGVVLFKITILKYFSSYQTSCQLLMEDQSCASIMLGCAVFYIADRIKRHNWFRYVVVITAVFTATALTTRRTSILTLIVVLFVYAVFHFKGAANKFLFTGLFALGTAFMIYYFLILRPVENFSQLISDNGRYANYASAISIIGENPLGVGYDNTYIVSIMEDGVIPHNTVMRWLCMGGWLFTVPLVIIITDVIRQSYRKRLSTEFWAVVYSVAASTFIPDIFNARYFIIPCAIIYMLEPFAGEIPESEETLEVSNDEAPERVKDT